MTGYGQPGGRWERLTWDLEAQAEAWDAAERAGEIAERQRIEMGRIQLVDRLRALERAAGLGGAGPDARAGTAAAADPAVVLACRGALRLHGSIARVVSDAVILDEDGGREALVSLTAVLTVTVTRGGRHSADPALDSAIASRINLRHLARSIARDRSVIRAHLVDGSVLDGTLDRVGADFVEIALHAAGEARRRDAVRETAVVALGALVAVRRDGG